jgi:hypothetical protein
MTFEKLLNSPVFFTDFIKNDGLFNSLKNKFPEILADLTSSRENPNCSCKGRVRNYLRSKFATEKEYFDSILNLEEIKKIIEEKKEDIENLVVDRQTEVVYPGTFGANSGKIFKIGKTEEDWNNLFKRLLRERFFFRSFSIIEKEDQLIVYFI